MWVMTLADGSENSADSFEVWLWYLESLGRLDAFTDVGIQYILVLFPLRDVHFHL